MKFKQTALKILYALVSEDSDLLREEGPCTNCMVAYKIIPDASGTFLLVVCYWIISRIRSVFSP